MNQLRPAVFYGRAKNLNADSPSTSSSDDPGDSGSEFEASDDNSDVYSDETDIDDNLINDESLEEEIQVEHVEPSDAWVEVRSSSRKFDFTEEEKIPNDLHNLNNAEHNVVYSLMVTDDVIDLVVKETNKYASNFISNTTFELFFLSIAMIIFVALNVMCILRNKCSKSSIVFPYPFFTFRRTYNV